MTVFVVVATLGGLALVAAGVWLLVRARRQLVRIEALLADRPAGLSEPEAAVVAATAARLAAELVARPSLPPELTVGADHADAAPSPRRSATRIKASGWAAGAGETVRRLRQGA